MDENVNVAAAAFLRNVGIEVATVHDYSWNGLIDDELIRSAVTTGFSCIVTNDRTFAREAASTLKLFPEISIVLLKLPQLPSEKWIKLFAEAWSAEVISPQPQTVVEWPTAKAGTLQSPRHSD